MGKSIILPWANIIRENVGNMGITADNKQSSWFSTDYKERISDGDFDAVVYGEHQIYHCTVRIKVGITHQKRCIVD